MYNLQCIPYAHSPDIQCTLYPISYMYCCVRDLSYIVHCTVYNVQCTMYKGVPDVLNCILYD